MMGRLILGFAVLAADAHPEKREVFPVRVSLNSAKESYVLGEPVLLDVTATNVTSRPERMLPVVVIPGVEPSIKVYISADGKQFWQWHYYDLIIDVDRGFEWLRPNESKHYRMGVVYSKQPSHLAFDRPGGYWVKICFPFVRGEPHPEVEIESNTIQFTVQHPQGDDLAVWQTVKREEWLMFLQIGGGAKKTALEAAGLLKSVQSSSYHDDLRSALATYYYRAGWGRDRPTDAEKGLLREALGLEGWPEFSWSAGGPTDRRLDHTYVEPILVREWHARRSIGNIPGVKGLLVDISKRTGVPLRIDFGPHLPGISIGPISEAMPLRRFMQCLVDPGRTAWFRDDDGYVLKVIDHLEQQRSKTAPTED